MASTDKRQPYRDVIDRLVRECRSGQGTIGASRARAGVWNANATPQFLPEQHQMNELFSRLSEQDRETVAEMLSSEFVSGVHATLVALHEAAIPPFDDGYEGTPFHDFVGRLGDWNWPE
jgi:hypothetical protein